jgi:succinoglycan biosynthesis protein ExoM
VSPSSSAPTSSESTVTQLPHISVCICTYKRPVLLKRLLQELSRQTTEGLFSLSVVIADNDEARSAEAVIAEMQADYPLPIKYCVESRRSIALARNTVVSNADGDFLAFIDDDEFPATDWLLKLFLACGEYGVDGVLGPVLRHFDDPPPTWLRKSRFYVRRVNPTGTPVDWLEARTGNVLLKREVIGHDSAPFRPEFRAGEDQDFFRRKIGEGYRFIWSSDANAYEVVPPARWKRIYLLKKALLRGATAGLQCDAAGVVKSLIAVPVYIVIAPLSLLFGQHHCMTFLVKLCDHLGKLLILVGINPIREQYVND